MVKPSEKEIINFRKYLRKQGFVTHLCDDSFYLYYKYGYVCVSIEYTKKGDFKGVRSFLSIGWENNRCSRFQFPNYYDLGSVRKLDRGYVEGCITKSTNVMVAISDMFEKIGKIVG